MEIRYLLFSDERKVQQLFLHAWSFLPFFSDLEPEKERLLSQLKNQVYVDPILSKEREGEQLIGFFQSEQLQMIACLEKKSQELLVSCVLLDHQFEISKKTYFDSLEKLAIAIRTNKITLQFQIEPTLVEKDRCLEAGYSLEEGKASKDIHIQPAIVFGGGGARGSYEIGVWKYLEEQRNLDFSVVVGTSIGAANAALMVCSSLKKAFELWEEIETSKIMEFDYEVPNDDQSMLGTLSTIGRMAITSVQNKGISNAPIYELLHKYYDLSLVEKSEQTLFIVVTDLLSFSEEVVDLAKKPLGERESWLLASGSVFPTMKAIKINENYYIDGGFKNNIPIDVAFLHGGNDLYVIDLGIPFFMKKGTPPENVNILTLKTPWQLGNMLLFDQKRTNFNIDLGFLETKRCFEKNTVGYWFTFEEENIEKKFLDLQREFKAYLSRNYPEQLRKLPSLDLLERLKKVYGKQVFVENFLQACLELLGKYSSLLPNRAYSIQEFVAALHHAKKEEMSELEVLLSLGEWVEVYYNKFVILSDTQQYQKVHSLLQINDEEKKKRIDFFWDKLPVWVILSLLTDFLEDTSSSET